MNLMEMGLLQARQGLLRGDFSCVEYCEALLKQCNDQSKLNAWIFQDAEFLIDAARKVDQCQSTKLLDFPLAGIPIGLKDNINTAHFPTSGGTKALRSFLPPKDAPVVENLSLAGALIAGKTNMHELAFGVTNNNFSTGPCRNPWNPQMIPGGSSGGSAVAVAARMVPAALGTDTGASVRLPAALCGVVGFRPSTGRYPGEGILPLSHTRDTVGPMTRSVEDAALLDSVLAGCAIGLPKIKLKGLRLGLPRNYFYRDIEPEVLTLVEQALSTLQSHGVVFVEADIEQLEPLNQAVGFPIVLHEAMQVIPEYLRKCSYTLNMQDLISEIASPDVAAIITSQLGPDAVTFAAYQVALRTRVRLQAAYAEHFSSHRLDALIFPTSILTARPIGEDVTVRLQGRELPTFSTFIRNTDPGSNAGIPGISIPIGTSTEGLPVGIELDGAVSNDRHLLAVAKAIEAALPPMQAPPLYHRA